MNFVENNGKKVAAILCVASAFPVVATVVAAKEEPGWHGDRYVNEDKTVAKGWQEIEGKSYYFSEDGTVNSSKTEKRELLHYGSRSSPLLLKRLCRQGIYPRAGQCR